MVSAWLLWEMGKMHLSMCILGVFLFVFLKEFWCIFFLTGTSCFTVLGLTKHLRVHVLNSPSMHGYSWAERQVGHHVHTHPLLDMKTDVGCPRHTPAAEVAMEADIWPTNSWNIIADLSPLSFLYSRHNFLTCFRSTEAQDKYSTFVRETKI